MLTTGYRPVLQAVAALPPGYRRDAPSLRKESSSEDSGKSDSDSASSSDADADDDAADATTTRADPPASAGAQAAPEASSSEESGKSDSDSTSYSDDERDPTDAAIDGTPASTEGIDLSRPATAQAKPASIDALFAGVTTIRAEDIGIGIYLGEGSFGKVYRGTWGAEAVALKEVDYAHARKKVPLSEEEFIEVMQWEVSRMASVSHPNLVQFHGLCRKEGKAYIVMELCEGGSLQEVLESGGIPPSRLWHWMRGIADALAFLHGQGMLHRDLKAANILIDGRGRARLADLGVAQVDALLDETEAKAVNMGMQDTTFIAPENIVAVQHGSLRQSSKATDIYALGTVLWQMVSGGALPSPWEVLLFDPVAKAALAAGVRMPIPQDCPQPVRELILSCWRTRPAERADIAAVQRQLRDMGPQLHPQAAIVDMLEHLEASVHPKRAQARDYVPTQVTARRVEGSVDDYWTQRELQAGAASVLDVTTGGYTSVNATTTNSTTTTTTTTNTLPSGSTAKAPGTKPNPPMLLQAALDDFVAQADPGALLLLGEGGMGKSISMVLLAERLLHLWWRHLADPTGVPRPRHLPVFLRDHVDEWSDAATADAWTRIAAHAGLAADAAQPLVFFDAYDECRINKKKATNLGKHLGLPGGAKLIVTCRPYVVKEEEQDDRFAWNGRLVVRHALPFTLDQLLDYLHARLDWDAATRARYQARLEQSAELRAVLRNPFLLYMLRQSWETVSKQPLEEMTRLQLYAGFIAHMADKGSRLLAPEVRGRLQGNGASLADSYAAFTESIALLAALDENASLPAHKAKRAASPWSRVEELIRDEAGRRYEEREARLARLDESRQREHRRRKVLSLEDFIAMRSQAAAQLHAMLPMRLRGGVYEYVHKSLFEYCAARKLLLEARRKHGGTAEGMLEDLLDWMETSAPGVLLFVDEFLQRAEAGKAAMESGVSDPDADVEIVQRRMGMVFHAVGMAMRSMQKFEKALAFHGKAVAIREKVFGTEHADTATSCNNMGSLLQDLGRHEEALAYFHKAMAVREKVFGTEHADTATSYNNMGSLLQVLGRHEEALAYQRKAMAVREKVFGTEDAATATSCNNMAVLLGDLGRHEEALAYSRKAMAVNEKVFGTDHAKTALSYNNIGALLQDLGRHEEALAYSRKAMAVREKVFGTEHSATANSYNNVGALLQDLGRHEEALAYFRKAMAVNEKVFGMEHAATATSYNNTGSLLKALGRHEEALVYYHKAMAIREKVFDTDHSATANSYNSMGTLLHRLGRHEEALVYYRKAMAVRKKVFGTEHAATATSYNNIGTLLADLGRPEEALAYYGKALAVHEKVLGTQHADTATSYYNMSSLLAALRRPKEALAYCRKAVAVREKVYGTEHAKTAATYNNMGTLLHRLDRPEEALAYYRKAMAAHEKISGAEHADTEACYSTMGSLLAGLDRPEEALAYYRKAMAVREKLFGTEHAKTATCYSNMGSLLADLDRLEEALAYYRKAIAVHEKVFGTEHAKTATCYNMMGSLLADLDRPEEALAYCHKAIAVHEKVFGTEHADTAACYSNLASLLADLDRTEEAVAYYRKALRIAETLDHPDADFYREEIASLSEEIETQTKPPSTVRSSRKNKSSRPSASRSTQSPHELLPRALQSSTDEVEESAGDDDPEAGGSSDDDGNARVGSRRKCVVM